MFCGGCGAAMVHGDRFCQACGRAAVVAGPPAPIVPTFQPVRTHAGPPRVVPPSQPRQSNAAGWIGLAVALVVVGAVAAWAIVDGKDDGAATETRTVATAAQTAPTATPPTTHQVSAAEVAAIADLAFGTFVATVDPYRVTVDAMGTEFACLAVSALNVGSYDRAPSPIEFTMVTPNGIVEGNGSYIAPPDQWDPTWGYFPTVVPNAVTFTILCFPTGGERGRFEVRYQPSSGAAPDAWSVTI